MSGKKSDTKEVAKSAKDGKFVSKDYAKKHPSTTIVQKVKK
ncbi:MAG: hypothetical protein AB7E46_10590 [Desulfovibrio sp.]|jgi:hypothetical protein